MRNAVVPALLGVVLGALGCEPPTVRLFAYNTNSSLHTVTRPLVDSVMRELSFTAYGSGVLVSSQPGDYDNGTFACYSGNGFVRCDAAVFSSLAYAAAEMVLRGVAADYALDDAAEAIGITSETRIDESPSTARRGVGPTLWGERRLLLPGFAGTDWLQADHSVQSTPKCNTLAAGFVLPPRMRTPAAPAGDAGAAKTDAAATSRLPRGYDPEVGSLIARGAGEADATADSRVLRGVLRYVMAYVVGHELVHATGGCEVGPSNPSIEAFAANYPSFQDLKVPCARQQHRDVVYIDELRGDLCGARVVSRVRALAERLGMSPSEDLKARKLALELLTHAIPRGLGSDVEVEVRSEVDPVAQAENEVEQQGFALRVAVGLCVRECGSARIRPPQGKQRSASSTWCKETCQMARETSSIPAAPAENRDYEIDGGMTVIGSPDVDGGSIAACDWDELVSFAACAEVGGEPLPTGLSGCLECSWKFNDSSCESCRALLARVELTTVPFDRVSSCIPDRSATFVTRHVRAASIVPFRLGYASPALRVELFRVSAGLTADGDLSSTSQQFLGRLLCKSASVCDSGLELASHCGLMSATAYIETLARWRSSLR